MTSFKNLISELKDKTIKLKNELAALTIAYKREDVPWYAKVIMAVAIGYAFSPIDLIPDFIPVLGYLDDLIIVPLLILLAVKLIPEDIMKDCRSQSKDILKDKKPKNYIAALVIILVWTMIVSLIIIKVIY